ncbi:MAG: TlpA disulfide reductase family protein [Bacteroidales bacterium]
MKKYILILFVALTASCGTNSNQFTVEGTLENSAQDTLYLANLGLQTITNVDSVVVGTDGVFSLSHETESPDFYLLRTDPQNYVTLIAAPGETIKVTGDIENLGETYMVEGSADSKLLMQMRRRLNKNVNELDSLGNVFRSSVDSPEFENTRARLNEESQAIFKDQRSFTMNFIEDNEGSLATMMALYQQIAPRRYVLNPEVDYAYFRKVDSALMANYPELPSVKALHQQVQDIEKHRASRENANSSTTIGSEAPEIALPNPDGEVIKLSSLRGNYVLLDFWAGWCRPCRIENPNLVEAYKKYHDKGFEIYQVSLDRERETWLKAIEDDNLTWTQVSDLKFWQSEAAIEYGVESIPANFLLDKEGKIIAKNLRADQLHAKLSEIFN